MKYDELLKILRECNDCICEKHCPYYEERNNPIRCMTKIVGDAADAIEELTDTNVGKWIPVGERLPEENSEVLIITERRDVIYGTFADGLFSDDWQYYTPDYVVCWMYIPEPPKEES